MPPFYWSDRW